MNDFIECNLSDEQIVDILKKQKEIAESKEKCPWCYAYGKPLKKHRMDWSVMDDDFGQFVRSTMIHYCPFCGRCIDGTN